MNRAKTSLLGAAFGLLALNNAHADLSANVQPYPAHQFGVTAAVVIGSVVNAYTSLNNLWAEATYRLECSDPAIRPVLSDSRGWSDNGIIGGKSITVTAPTMYPSNVGLPGWNAVMGGTVFDCVFSYTGSAKTSFLPIGSSGTTFTFGGDSWQESGHVTFPVIKMGTLWGGKCIM